MAEVTNETREQRYIEALRTVPGAYARDADYARAVMAVADAEQAELRAEVDTLTRLLGSHADGHRCTCTIIKLADNRPDYLAPAEWEQDPWCPTHPDVDQIKAELLALADEWDAKADDGEEHGYSAAAQAVRIDAKELRAALAGPEPDWLNCPVCGSGEFGDCACPDHPDFDEAWRP